MAVQKCCRAAQRTCNLGQKIRRSGNEGDVAKLQGPLLAPGLPRLRVASGLYKPPLPIVQLC